MNDSVSFDWGTGSEGEKKSHDMGASFGDIPASPADSATSQAHSIVESFRKGKRGRKSKDELDALESKRQEEFAREFQTLFDPKIWGGICRAPADLMLHVSGRDLWRVEERELEPLSVSAAHTARLFLRTDPKWVALTMLAISLTQIYGARIALHIAQSRKESTEKRESK